MLASLEDSSSSMAFFFSEGDDRLRYDSSCPSGSEVGTITTLSRLASLQKQQLWIILAFPSYLQQWRAECSKNKG